MLKEIQPISSETSQKGASDRYYLSQGQNTQTVLSFHQQAQNKFLHFEAHLLTFRPSVFSEAHPESKMQVTESYLHICQCGTEVLVNVGFKDRIEMLELDVPNQ